MIADLSTTRGYLAATTFIRYHLKEVIEIKVKRPKRTLSQNRYLHVCISLYATEFGYTLEESKTHLKRACPWMRYEKNGEVFLKSTSGMDSGELTAFIDWIRNYASAAGLYIPTPEEYIENQYDIEVHIEKHRAYL